MKQLDRQIQQHFKAIYILLLLFAVFLYGVFSLNTVVWADEAYTFALIKRSLGEIWKITAADVHPPLYYFFMKLITAPFGYHLWVSRFVSAIPCILAIALGGFQIRKLFGERTALLFMLLYLLYPYTMTYATEVRMYSLAELFVTLNAIYAYRCWLENNPRVWVVFSLTGVCTAYTHYFALVSAGIIYGILLFAAVFKKRQLLKGWLLAYLATIILFLPWLGSFVSQLVYKVNHEYWIEPITIRTVINYILTVFSASGMTSFPLFFGLAYVIALAALVGSKNKQSIILCVCALAVPLGTVVVGLAASILVRPVFVIRYILPSLPLVIFFFAYVLGNLINEMLFSALLTVSIMGGTSNLMVMVRDVFSPSPDQISSIVSQLPEHDSYVVASGNTLHASQELAYHEPETPVYTTDVLGLDNPYLNRMPYNTFLPEEHQSVILVLEDGQEVPAEFLEVYSVELIYSAVVSGTRQALWHMTPKIT